MLLSLLTHVAEARALIRRLNLFFLAFLVLAISSVLWSADPGATLARYVSYSATVLASFAFCLSGWHRQRLQNVVRPLLTLLLFGSLIYILMDPKEALDFDGAGYHGLSGQKNPFGELCAFGTLFWMHGWIAGEVKLWKAIGGAALGWTCLWLSKSATSLLATVFASCLLLMLLRSSPSIRRYTPYLVTVFGCLVVAYALAILQLVPGLATILLGPITAITGKDMTFSNRSMIWDIIKEHAQLHPLLGTGYGAYWTGAVPSSPSYVFLSRMYFWPSEAHNGYLDVVNDLGFVGLICLLGYLLIYVRQSLHLFRSRSAAGCPVPCAVLPASDDQPIRELLVLTHGDPAHCHRDALDLHIGACVGRSATLAILAGHRGAHEAVNADGSASRSPRCEKMSGMRVLAENLHSILQS